MRKVISRFADAALQPLLPPGLALRQVTSKSGKGVYASSDTLFKGAVFGRDSIEVAEDLLYIKPRLVKRIILTLASLQGEEINDLNEEEPGKIVHEYRSSLVDGKPIKGSAKHIFEELGSRWGGSETELAYYGSIDATPHFIRLVGAYTHRYGPMILDQPVALRSGHRLSLRLVVENALDWLRQKLTESQSGLLEYQRRNPRGIENQVWKDSKEFFVHENGLPANHEQPIASIEVQGYAYDALVSAALMIKGNHEAYEDLATKLRNRAIELLWMPERRYFALGADYSKSGDLRIMRTSTANPEALLDTLFFMEVPEAERALFIQSIVRKMMSPDFLTDAGIRSRAMSEGHLVEYWDYHGSYVSWPKETYDIAKGMRRQGFPELAKQLENRLLNLTLRSRSYPEFVYVDEWGRVMASAPESQEHGELTIIDSTNNPESVQAWTVSAMLAIATNRFAKKFRRLKPPTRADWQIQTEQELLRYIPKVNRHLNPWTLAAKYPHYPYKVVKGKSVNSTDMPAR
jgi:glycogen debranching enzyme